MNEYYEALIALGVSKNDYSYEKCYQDYIEGSVGKWMWYLGFFGVANLPESVVQYFHDQLVAFMVDHKVDPLAIGQPRP